MDIITLRSPAKVNLSLKIVSKREDGYHNLDSIFQAISLSDELQISFSNQDKLEIISHPQKHNRSHKIPSDRTNLVWRAVDLFRQKTGWMQPLHIVLKKNIPHEAGLGGGSSNAASALYGCHKLSSLSSIEEIQELSGMIGSDIPFFFSSGIARCMQRGEKVYATDPIQLPHQFWVVKPNISLSTPKVYGAFKLESEKKSVGNQLFCNDLEKPAFLLAPDLALLKKELEESFDHVVLCGSGSSFFCIGQKAPKDHLGQVFEVSPIFKQPFKWF